VEAAFPGSHRYRPACTEPFKAVAGKHMTLTQGEVGDHFVLLVPIFVDFGNGWSRVGQVGIAGKTTRMADVMLPGAPKKVALNGL